MMITQNNQAEDQEENMEPSLGELLGNFLRAGAIIGTIIFLFWYSDGDLSNLPWSENGGGVQLAEMIMEEIEEQIISHLLDIPI
jgi:hypothetical protein